MNVLHAGVLACKMLNSGFPPVSWKLSWNAEFLRWPTSTVAHRRQNYGGPHLPRQNLLFHGNTYFSTAKLTFPRQNLLFYGKTYFLTAKLTFPRQNLLFYGKTYFLTAKLTFSRQNLLFHGKTYFSTAKLTFSRQNLLFHGKTYFSIPSFQSVSAYAFPRWRSGNFQQSNMADGEEDPCIV